MRYTLANTVLFLIKYMYLHLNNSTTEIAYLQKKIHLYTSIYYQRYFCVSIQIIKYIPVQIKAGPNLLG